MDGELDIANYIMQSGFAGMCIILLIIGYKMYKEKQRAIDSFIDVTRQFIANQKSFSILISRNNEILDSIKMSLHEIRIYLNLKNNKLPK